MNAEMAALGSCIAGNDETRLKGLAILRPEYFKNDSHRAIFQAVHELHLKHLPVDTVTVAETVEPAHRQHVFDVTNAVPSALHVEHYAKLVRRAYHRERFVAAASKAVRDPESQDDILALREAMQSLNADSTGVISVQDALRSYVDVTLNDRATNRILPINSGLPSFDRTGGFVPGQLIAVGARTSSGKTSLLLRMSIEIMRQGHKVLFISAEMSAHELLDRMVAMDSGIPLWRIRHQAVKEHMPQVLTACGKINSMPLVIREGGALNMAGIEADTQADPKVVVVDYLQRLTPPGSAQNRAAFYSDVANGLKALAMQRRVVVIAASQFNRDIESRPDKTPTLADFKESGGIEEAADIALLLAPPEDPMADVWHVDLIVGKYRNGPRFKIPLRFDAKIARFDEEEPQGL
jgi:replicative DNA helicase